MTSSLTTQFGMLLMLAFPIACIAWTITHEEIFKEPREYCVERSKDCKTIFQRKFFYLFTCEYCFSHYIALFVLIITNFKLIYDDWTGYFISGFSLVWIANVYMSLFGRIRIDIKKEKIVSQLVEKELVEKENQSPF